MKNFLLPLLGLLLGAQGCSYAISSDMVRQADRAITFEQLQTDPTSYKGKTVILGGTIYAMTNRKNDTVIEVVEKKLDLWGKPRRTDKSGGHFLVIHHGALDPMLYAPGSDLTVAGEVVAPGEAGSALVTVRSRELKFWPRERPGWDRPQWVDPLYNPYEHREPTGY
jgi:outer membrane lipoprotein